MQAKTNKLPGKAVYRNRRRHEAAFLIGGICSIQAACYDEGDPFKNIFKKADFCRT